MRVSFFNYNMHMNIDMFFFCQSEQSLATSSSANDHVNPVACANSEHMTYWRFRTGDRRQAKHFDLAE